MFNFISLKFLTSKKILASVVAVTGSATATYFWWKAQGEGNGISQQVATTRAKLERSRPNYSQLLQRINSSSPSNIPEGLRAAYQYKDDPIMAERWAGLFCEDGKYDINDSNYMDYREYCNAG
ncbi:hypothetical protein HF1_05050 [Mycoplasma haemofelis str. Langford 1]|uniref:Uncharacterized protein n=1 Tax=Mycoplasma haemofelis (strain Langford 1) TaxID=941640 RepID=E8ZH92_MYCHL|nr:hypothetical protein [Mycoplasma haemofelis]CBY92513.1 hypothetical protein HF1_05050 [Mycoplasma haemofelis str. Langford 1]